MGLRNPDLSLTKEETTQDPGGNALFTSGSLLRELCFEGFICLDEGRQRIAGADIRSGDLQSA